MVFLLAFVLPRFTCQKLSAVHCFCHFFSLSSVLLSIAVQLVQCYYFRPLNTHTGMREKSQTDSS